MTKTHFLSALLLLVAVSTLSLAGCTSDSGTGTVTQGTVTGTATFNFSGVALANATDWPNSTDTTTNPTTGDPNVAFPGNIKIAFNPANSAGVPTAGPVTAIPGTGSTAGLAFSSLSAGKYNYSTATSAVPKLDNGTYLVSVTYVNPYLTGQASQQSIGSSVVTVNGDVAMNLTGEVKIAKDSMTAARKRNTPKGVISGVLKATNPADWPAGNPFASPATADTVFIGLVGYKISPPPPGAAPDLFAFIAKPTSGDSSAYNSGPRDYGTYKSVAVYRFSTKTFQPIAAGGPPSPLATYSDFSLTTPALVLPTKTVTFPPPVAAKVALSKK